MSREPVELPMCLRGAGHFRMMRVHSHAQPNGSRLTRAAKGLLFWKRLWLLLTEHLSLTKCPTPSTRRGAGCSRLLGGTEGLTPPDFD